jgi:hypothetical protein
MIADMISDHLWLEINFGRRFYWSGAQNLFGRRFYWSGVLKKFSLAGRLFSEGRFDCNIIIL